MPGRETLLALGLLGLLDGGRRTIGGRCLAHPFDLLLDGVLALCRDGAGSHALGRLVSPEPAQPQRTKLALDQPRQAQRASR